MLNSKHGMAIALSALLGACEAEVDLTAVEQSAAQTTRRFDQFLGATGVDGTLIVVGTRGIVLESNDSGANWRRHEIVSDASADDPYARPHFIDVAACPDGAFAAVAMERSVWVGDGGPESWVQISLPTEETPLAIACDRQGELWITATFSTLLRSADKGRTWQQTEFGEDAQLTAVQVPQIGHPLVFGEFGILLASDDGGASWQRRPSVGNEEFYPQTAYFDTPDSGWVGGLTGTILFTDDGGQSWRRQETGIDSPIYNFIRTDGALFAVGDHGTVLRLRGERWEKVPTNGNAAGYLRAVAPLDDGRLLVAGAAGKLLLLDTRGQAATAIR